VKSDEHLKLNPYCIIKYQLGSSFKENKYKLKEELEVSKSDNHIEVSFEKISQENNNNIENITYTAYLYDKNINIDYYNPEIIKEKEKYLEKIEIDKTDEENIKVEFIINNIEYDKEYSIVVLATVKYDDGSEEYFIYKTHSLKFDNERKNDLIFYIIMGSFAFTIILVFIIIFCIINKKKANNPDIDDEEYSNLQIRKEAINEDEF
jgi:hypothetical protein